MSQARFMLAACASGSGKTTVTCGLIRAFVNRGRSVASFKCGPDYIDPMFHSRMLHTKSRNLDTYFTGEDMTRYLFGKGQEERDLSIMEGVMGYYDGMGLTDTRASSYDLAKVTETPVILLVNVRGMSLSVLAQIKGFLTFRAPSQIKGILLNQTSEMMCRGLADQIEEEFHVPVLGYIPKVPHLALESRHLGLVLPGEVADLNEKLDELAKILEGSVDLDAIEKIAMEAPLLTTEAPDELKEVLLQAEPIRKEGPVLAVAKDEAFCFHYADNIALLRELGAKIRYFSPIRDEKLPEGASGLLLYGGYPELMAKELSENTAMLGVIRQALADGMPCLAECGGFLYLQESLEDMEGHTYPMVGAIASRGYRTDKLGRFGYIELHGEREGILGGDRSLKGHEFHYFDSTDCGKDFQAKKPSGKRSWQCIHGGEQRMIGFPHIYYYSNPAFALDFLKICQKYKSSQEEQQC